MNTSTYQTLLRQIEVTTTFAGRCLERLFQRLRNASYTVIAVASIVAIALCSVAMADGENHDAYRYDESAEFDSAIKHYEAENFAKAREIWANAAAKGGVRSQYRLGEIYEYGVGVDKDVVEAHLWYSLAADAGSLRSERALFRIENLMSEEQIISAQMLLAEFSPIYTASISKSDKSTDRELTESAPDSASTKDAVVENSSLQQPAQAAPGSAAKNNGSSGANPQANPDSIDARLFAAIPATTPETTKTDSQVTGSSSRQSLQQTDNATKSEFERRRMKLVSASGPGPQIVNDAVHTAAVSESTAQTAADIKSARVTKIASVDATASSETVAHAESRTTDANGAIADTAIIKESVSSETGSGKVVGDEAVDDEADGEQVSSEEVEVLTESVDVARSTTETASAKSSGANSALKTVALKQPAAAASIATTIKPQDNTSTSRTDSRKLTTKAADLTKISSVRRTEPVKSQAAETEHKSVNGAVGEVSNLKQLVAAPSAQVPQLVLVETDQNSPKSLLEQHVPSGLTDASGDRQGVQSIQQMLTQLGYKIDGESGQIGPQTRKAIQAFRRDSALLVSTLIDVDFLAALYKRHAAVTN